MLPFIILYTAIISAASLLIAYVLSVGNAWNKRISFYLVNFAAGTLLTAALLDLLPEAFENLGSAKAASALMFAGILVLFFSERFLIWFHHHHDPHEKRPSWIFINVGDGIHNFIDGVTIASAVFISPAIGLATAFAIFMHEIPQELADLTIMLHDGLTRKKALVMNMVSAVTAVFGGVAGYFFLNTWEHLTGYLIAFAAGNFVYIACADLIPELHTASMKRSKVMQTVAFVSGIVILLLTMRFAELITGGRAG